MEKKDNKIIHSEFFIFYTEMFWYRKYEEHFGDIAI